MTYLQEFIASKKFKNDATAESYTKVIKRLTNKFGENLETLSNNALNQFIYGEFSEYLVSKDGNIKSKKYALTTFEKNVGMIKSFLNYLYDSGKIKSSYAAAIESTEQERSITKGDLPSASELEKIISHLEGEAKSSYNYFTLRDLLIFNLVFHSGISTNELSSIKAEMPNVSGNSYQLSVLKPNLRLVNINSSDAKLLVELLKLRNAIITDSYALFISEKHKQGLPRRSIGYLINRFCLDAGIQSYSAETFSKAGILAALSIGYDISDLAADINVKEDYLKRRVRFSHNHEKVKSYADLFIRDSVLKP
ncbi:MAG: hypothetical protein IBX70_11745 [Clostridia bacterium]|nr:hypothetical protein [Clostridia bacterium]